MIVLLPQAGGAVAGGGERGTTRMGLIRFCGHTS